MRTAAALSLVVVVLLGGAVIGTVTTDLGPSSGVDAGDGDETTDEETVSFTDRNAATPQGQYEEDPREDFQDDDTPTETPEETETPTPTPTETPTETETPTPTPTETPEETETPTETPTETETPTPTPTETPEETETPTPTPTESPTPTPTEAEDDDGGFPWWGGSDPTPTPTEEPTETPTQTPTDASFEVVDASLESDTVGVGEYVEVTAMVENQGERDGTFEAALQVNGQTVGTEAVTVAAGDVETVSFQVQFENPGEYDIAVSDTEAGTIEVTPREMDEDGEVEVIDAVVPADVVRPGVETTVRATVENPTDQTVDTVLVVTIDGEEVAEVEVSLGPQERTEVTIPFEAQEGTVAVNGVEAGHLQVDEGAEGDGADEADQDEPAGMGSLGFGLIAAAIIVAGAILVAGAVRWQSDDSMLGTLENRRR